MINSIYLHLVLWSDFQRWWKWEIPNWSHRHQIFAKIIQKWPDLWL